MSSNKTRSGYNTTSGGFISTSGPINRLTPVKREEKKVYCPDCGTGLIRLGITSMFKKFDSDERIITDYRTPQMKKFLSTENGKSWSREGTAYLMTCPKCEWIFVEYGMVGRYFDIIGRLDRDIVATILASKLSPE